MSPAARKGRRIGRWTYVQGCGWLLDGTNIVIDKNAGRDQGWYVTTGSGMLDLDGIRCGASSEIDRFLDASMEWVERYEGRYVAATAGHDCGNCGSTHAAGVAIVVDRDCPSCNWPELVAEGKSIEAGPERVICRKCGWSEAVAA